MSSLIRLDQATTATTPVGSPNQEIWIDQYLDQKEGDLIHYYRILLKRKWLILAVLLTVLAAVTIRVYTLEPLYKSTAKIQIDPEQSVLPYKEIYDPTGNPQYLKTQTEILKSKKLAVGVVKRLNLTKDPGRLSMLASALLGNLEVAPVEGTQVVKVSYISADPRFAAKAINALAEEYVDYNFESKYEATTRARDFLEKELMNLKKKLERSEEELIKYARDNNIVLIAQESDNIIIQKLADLNKQMNNVEAQLLANQYELIRNATPADFPERLKTRTMVDLQNRFSALEQKRTSLLSQFGPKWPEVITVQQEIAGVQKQLADETERGIEQARIDYRLTEQHRRRIAAALEEQNRVVSRLSEDSIQYNILKREVETDRQLYEGLLQRLKEAGVSAGLKSSNIHVIDRGEIPSRPFSPNIPKNMAVGFAGGLFLGVLLAFFFEYVDRTIKTPEDVEQSLGLASLAVIPSLGKAWKESAGLLVEANGNRAEEGRIVPYVRSMSQLCWESYRSLRTSLLLSSPEKPPQTILVTSALPNEGKTTTCINLGISLAQTGSRTLLIELDMRKPKMAERFQLDRDQGMSTYLSGNSDLSNQVQPTGIPNLFVVTAGPIPPNPPELIGSGRMDLAMRLLSQYFKYIVVDSPPLLSVTDALVISPHVDGVLLVIQGAKTPKEAVRKARNQLTSVGARIVGTLINGIEIDKSTYGYYYGYDEDQRYEGYSTGG